ncbi:unnamed protein product [Caenorhabditis angaria]|uniref:Nop domain-containing protein n=1 Tax=Caenorhabditis angaria TaxID=860376 RepID=A0A9P1MXY9_9PELO|nr:unnamed protein product [Caenorhabditis angaria]
MSLAEELMADFDVYHDDDDDDTEKEEIIEEDDGIEEATEEAMDVGKYQSVFDVAKLAKGEEYQEELETVMEACNLAEKLHMDRLCMHRLVEIRMSLIAPNLVNLLGASTTALLVSQAGGLAPLSRMPACNVQVLGKQKRNLVGFFECFC